MIAPLLFNDAIFRSENDTRRHRVIEHHEVTDQVDAAASYVAVPRR